MEEKLDFHDMYLLGLFLNAKFNPLSPTRDRFFAEFCNPITRQAIELESCSNPLRIQKVL